MSRRGTPGGELPLMAWGEELRRRKAKRRRLRSRATSLTALIGTVALSAARPPAPRLVWNASASAPIGLYLVSTGSDARRGDMVIARVPIGVRALAAARRYIPVDVPLVKHVGAVPGDTFCAIGTTIAINNQTVATRRATDGVGRRMPWWDGCRTLHQGDVFLLADHVSASFDGRYFGISSSTDIIGTARPIWTR